MKRTLIALVLLAATVWAGEAGPLTLTLKLDKVKVKRGEPIDLSFTLTNGSQKALVVADPSASPRPTLPSEDWGVMLRVVDPEGRVTLVERTDDLSRVTEVRRADLPLLSPGDSLTGRARLGERHHPYLNKYERWVIYRPGRHSITEREMNLLSEVFGQSGRYRISAIYRNKIGEYREGRDVVPVDAWKGTVEAPPVELTIY